jgi:hypothetical protein
VLVRSTLASLDPDAFRNCDHLTRWTSSSVFVVVDLLNVTGSPVSSSLVRQDQTIASEMLNGSNTAISDTATSESLSISSILRQ